MHPLLPYASFWHTEYTNRCIFWFFFLPMHHCSSSLLLHSSLTPLHYVLHLHSYPLQSSMEIGHSTCARTHFAVCLWDPWWFHPVPPLIFYIHSALLPGTVKYFKHNRYFLFWEINKLGNISHSIIILYVTFENGISDGRFVWEAWLVGDICMGDVG